MSKTFEKYKILADSHYSAAVCTLSPGIHPTYLLTVAKALPHIAGAGDGAGYAALS
jgi:hypothetical protein